MAVTASAGYFQLLQMLCFNTEIWHPPLNTSILHPLRIGSKSKFPFNVDNKHDWQQNMVSKVMD